MATRAVKLPTSAMVDLYDMSREGLPEGEEEEVGDFDNVFDIEEDKLGRNTYFSDIEEDELGRQRLFRERPEQAARNKYKYTGDDAAAAAGEREAEFGLAAGIRSMARGNKKQAETLAANNGKPKVTGAAKGKGGSGKNDLIVAMATEMRAGKKSLPSTGQGVGRKAFSSMAGQKSVTSSAKGGGGGRMTFRGMADSAVRASTLTSAVEAFRDAGRETEARRQERFRLKFAGRGRAAGGLGKRESTLSVSGVNFAGAGAGVGGGVGADTGGDLFANLPQ